MPLQAGDISGVQVTPDASLIVNGQLERGTAATFNVRGNGPWRVTLPTREVTKTALAEKMAALAEQVVTVLESVPEVTRVIPGVSGQQSGPRGATVDVEFLVNGQGPFTAFVPLQNWTAEDAIAAAIVRRDAILHAINFTG